MVVSLAACLVAEMADNLVAAMAFELAVARVVLHQIKRKRRELDATVNIEENLIMCPINSLPVGRREGCIVGCLVG